MHSTTLKHSALHRGATHQQKAPINSSSARLFLARTVVARSHANQEVPKATVPLSNDSPKRTQSELVLDHAESDLRELCTTTGGEHDCWKALNYYVEKRHDLSEHCDLEHDIGPRDEVACSSLHDFEKFAREQMATGSVANLRNNLLILERAEERRLAAAQAAVAEPVDALAPRRPTAAAASAVTQIAELSPEELHRRANLVRLFHRLDTNQDGKINLFEFQAGMEELGAVLTEGDMQQIRDSLPCDDDSTRAETSVSCLDVDSFIDILDASPILRGVSLGGGDSNFLRHASHIHGLHGRYHVVG